MRAGRGVGVVSALLALVASSGTGLMAQSTDPGSAFVQRCAGGDASVVEACADVGASIYGTGMGLALLSTGGGLAPVAPNTLGHRLASGGSRFAFTLQARATGVASLVPGAGAGPSQPVEGTAWALQATGTVGLFDGFQPLPSVGGVLAVDVFGGTGLEWMPAALVEGAGWGLRTGARVGLLRESFTAPGLALDLGWSRSRDATLVDRERAETASFHTSTRALRISIGKDLWGVGLSGGAGRDWVSIPATVRVGASSDEELEATRDVVFGGATLNYLVLQLNAEVGWARGGDSPALRRLAVDPAEGRLFWAAGARLVF